MVGLKACPTCNESPSIVSYMSVPHTTEPFPMYYVQCTKCGARTKSMPIKIMAILKWNKMVKQNA